MPSNAHNIILIERTMHWSFRSFWIVFSLSWARHWIGFVRRNPFTFDIGKVEINIDTFLRISSCCYGQNSLLCKFRSWVSSEVLTWLFAPDCDPHCHCCPFLKIALFENILKDSISINMFEDNLSYQSVVMSSTYLDITLFLLDREVLL